MTHPLGWPQRMPLRCNLQRTVMRGGTMSRGLIGTIIGVLVVIILVIVILRLT